MSKRHKIFRWVIYSICLLISTGLIMYFLWHLSNNWIYHFCVPWGVLAVELLAQYFLSLGKSKFKDKKRLQGVLLIFVYAVYVLLFGVLSAVGFFAAEISTNISVTTKVQRIDNLAQKRYDQIDNLIASLNMQMTTEAKTGFGKNSQAILNEIKRLKAEQSALIDQMNKDSKQENTAAPVDAFSALAKLISVNANILAIIIFGSLCLFVYTGLTVCNPNLELGETDNKTDGVTDKKKSNAQPVTESNTVTDKNVTNKPPVTNEKVTELSVTEKSVTEKSLLPDNRNIQNDTLRTCPICNGPVKGNGIYCGSKCKQAAYRNRHNPNTAIAG